jgi:hypothetical protein
MATIHPLRANGRHRRPTGDTPPILFPGSDPASDPSPQAERRAWFLAAGLTESQYATVLAARDPFAHRAAFLADHGVTPEDVQRLFGNLGPAFTEALKGSLATLQASAP